MFLKRMPKYKSCIQTCISERKRARCRGHSSSGLHMQMCDQVVMDGQCLLLSSLDAWRPVHRRMKSIVSPSYLHPTRLHVSPSYLHPTRLRVSTSPTNILNYSYPSRDEIWKLLNSRPGAYIPRGSNFSVRYRPMTYPLFQPSWQMEIPPGCSASYRSQLIGWVSVSVATIRHTQRLASETVMINACKYYT